MAVDIVLNRMINEMDDRLFRVPLRDVELSIRTYTALAKLGARSLGDAQRLLINRQLHKYKGIGPKAIKEVEEIITNVVAVLPAASVVRERKMQEVLESFLSWTGALAVAGVVTSEAWRELISIRSKAEALVVRED